VTVGLERCEAHVGGGEQGREPGEDLLARAGVAAALGEILLQLAMCLSTRAAWGRRRALRSGASRHRATRWCRSLWDASAALWGAGCGGFEPRGTSATEDPVGLDADSAVLPGPAGSHTIGGQPPRTGRLDAAKSNVYGSNVRFAGKTTIVRSRALGLGLCCFFTADIAGAFTAPQVANHGLQLTAGKAARQRRDVVWNRAPLRAVRGHDALKLAIGATDTIWDAATRVPLRMWGAGVHAPGAVGSANLAASNAGELLRQHVGVLAPGSAAEDFVLVGNDLSAGIRSVGFRQHYRGRPVIGGQVSFRFKADRLVALGSEALPDVQATLTSAPIDDKTARARAQADVLTVAAEASAGVVEGPFILPIVDDGGVRAYREVLRVTVEASAPIGRFAVYLDAASGEPVAREQLLHFASGKLQFHVPERGPQGKRVDLPATRLNVQIAGVAGNTDMAGALTIPDGPAVAVALGVDGALVKVVNKAGLAAATDVMLAPGGVSVWQNADDAAVDAQLAAYIHAGIVKEYVRGIAPDFKYLDGKVQVRVNIDQTCNAYSEGDAINFFRAGDGCENTGRIGDIIYHEFGHSVHQQSLIPGVGAFDGSVSEGIADYLGMTINNDSGLGRGFFVDSPDAPLRELNPDNKEFHWPEDLHGEPHDDGMIIAGTLWDLRTALRTKLGAGPGTAQTDHIWFESIRRAVDIPSMYPEALLADDDDGDLANGTPNECEINKAFHAHGLVLAGGAVGSVALGAATDAGTPVDYTLDTKPRPCLDLKPESATLRWRPAGVKEYQELVMDVTPAGFTALLPKQGDDTLIEYQVVSALSDGTEMNFPVNAGDPWYQLYTGPVKPLYCTGFEGPDDLEGWMLGSGWGQGAPQGQGGDPMAAFAGDAVVGQNLAGTYKPSSFSKLTGPVIDTQGFKKVRLQYRRWLGVEDGHFDDAMITVNNLPAWRNFDSKKGDSSNVHHHDREWRFHDIDITPGVIDGKVQLGFQLQSDEGLELGGWNLDALCVVGVEVSASGTCGDGVQGAGEECDDGNQVADDGCSPTCTLEGETPTTSDGEGGSSGDPGASSGDGGDGSSSSGEGSAGADNTLDDEGCGCRSSGGPGDLAGLGLGLLGLAGLRRRRRAR
jgi:MYXO-CTERM domain-containing protein